MDKVTKAQVNRIVEGLYALLVARELILEGKKTMESLAGGNDLLRAVAVVGYAVPASALMTKAFGTGELRDEALKVLAKIVKGDK